MMGKRLKEIFGLILINITLVSGSLNAETVYADTQAKIEIEKTEMPLKICVDEENKKTVLQIVAAWKKIYKNNGVELMDNPIRAKGFRKKKYRRSRMKLRWEKDRMYFWQRGRIRPGVSKEQLFLRIPKKKCIREPFFR